MKKIFSALLLTFVSMSFASPSFAVITPEEAMSQTYIQGHGYSGEMSRLIDLQNSQINCTQTKYKSTDPALYADKKVNFVRKVFMYFDCGLDDGKFMNHDTKFTTRYDDL
jgi:hypothetical protein